MFPRRDGGVDTALLSWLGGSRGSNPLGEGIFIHPSKLKTQNSKLKTQNSKLATYIRRDGGADTALLSWHGGSRGANPLGEVIYIHPSKLTTHNSKIRLLKINILFLFSIVNISHLLLKIC
ncbi:hypothetical protein [Alishewanella sp. HL-SH05]|uniref:hypothetical protein n=1 Tax=Alishewanella sp. HL-SH05 TaxID=3461145 RepID=UPI004041C3C6